MLQSWFFSCFWWTVAFLLLHPTSDAVASSSTVDMAGGRTATVGGTRIVEKNDDDENNMINIKSNVVGVPQEYPTKVVCACQPTFYSFKLNHRLTCDDRTIFTGNSTLSGIQSVMCTQPQDTTANALTAIVPATGRPFVPTITHKIVITEMDKRGKVLKRQTIDGPFEDGEEVTFYSVLADAPTVRRQQRGNRGRGSSLLPPPSLNPSLQDDFAHNAHHSTRTTALHSDDFILPQRLEIKFLGYPGGAVWSMAYSQDCRSSPILEKGHSIVRALMTDVGRPAAAFCPLPDAPSTSNQKTTKTPSKQLLSSALPSSITIPTVVVFSMDGSSKKETTSSTNRLSTISDAAAVSSHPKFLRLLPRASLRPVRGRHERKKPVPLA